MAQIVECLPRECEAPSSNSNTTKKKERKKEKWPIVPNQLIYFQAYTLEVWVHFLLAQLSYLTQEITSYNWFYNLPVFILKKMKKEEEEEEERWSLLLIWLQSRIYCHKKWHISTQCKAFHVNFSGPWA
jgi:hypothetical protein